MISGFKNFNKNFETTEKNETIKRNYQDLCLLLGDPVRSGDNIGWSLKDSFGNWVSIWANCSFRRYMNKYISRYSISNWNIASNNYETLDFVLGDFSFYKGA